MIGSINYTFLFKEKIDGNSVKKFWEFQFYIWVLVWIIRVVTKFEIGGSEQKLYFT